MNKKERRLALATAMQSAAEDMTVVENLDGQVKDGKTKTLLAMLKNVGVALGGGGETCGNTRTLAPHPVRRMRACVRAVPGPERV